jgi:multidrug efflux system membrane fusion protein
VTIRSRVDGELVAVHFVEGQHVARGELLAEIDPRPFEVQLAQAEGQLARDEALLANAKVDLARYRALAKDDAVPTAAARHAGGARAPVRRGARVDRGQIDAAKLNLAYSRVTAPVDGRIGLRLVDPGNIVHASDAGGLAVVTQVRPIDVVFPIRRTRSRRAGEGARR